MIKSFFAITIFFLVSTAISLFAQNDSIHLPKNYITIDLLKPFSREYAISYERMLRPKDFLRIHTAYRFPKNTDSFENTISAPIVLNNKRIVFTAYTFSFGYGRFLSRTNKFYFAADISYRYSYYKDKVYYACVGTSMDSNVYLESEFNNDYGIIPQIGVKISVNKMNRVRFIIDPYAGIGLTFRNQKRIIYAEGHGTCSSDGLQYLPTPVETYKSFFSPTVVFGIRIGVGF